MSWGNRDLAWDANLASVVGQADPPTFAGVGQADPPTFAEIGPVDPPTFAGPWNYNREYDLGQLRVRAIQDVRRVVTIGAIPSGMIENVKRLLNHYRATIFINIYNRVSREFLIVAHGVNNRCLVDLNTLVKQIGAGMNVVLTY